MRGTLLAAGLVLVSLNVQAADPKADPATLMAERGKVLFQEDFARPLSPEWRSAKGKWEIADGALRGAERKVDMHGAVTRHALPYRNVVIQYSFKLDGTRQTSLSINDAKGHCCRVVINPTGFTVQKDSHDKNVTDKAAVLQRVETPIKPGEWHTVVVELLGKEMLARVDGGPVAYGANDTIDVDKANFGLTVAGEAASFKNLRVWEALPSKTWESTRAKLLPTK